MAILSHNTSCNSPHLFCVRFEEDRQHFIYTYSTSSEHFSLSTSPAARPDQYEVFLSFRGKDTRTRFTDHLHKGLKGAGIDTFLDDDELHIGEEIGPELLNAIENSKISIPVLSKDYASSKWCLIELTKMAGSYEKAFQEHQKNFDSATVEEWKKALRKVGRLKGWEVKNRHETKLIDEVISRVLEEVRGNSVVENECLVGIEGHVEEMMKLLSVNSKDVRIVGIHGMGGIGKTTIAKVIYHQLSQHFVSCCFLADVRKTEQHKGIVHLQNQLISNILKRRCLDVSTMDEGINAIKKRFSKKKVLVVIDDVSHKIHLHALVGKCDWFGSGSRIIVTTRDKEILNSTEVNWTYEPKELDSNQSLQLFSWNAFRRVHPPKDYHTLSRNVVSTTGGLPLALEVIGSFLSGKGKEVWKDTLKKLKRMPDGHVQKKLRISYEALEYEQQQIFLDIACLFIGVDKRIAFHMWDDCNFYPENGIEVLRHMSLVRDLGRDIVRQENFMDPGKRSRVWSHKEAFDILESLTGTRKIEALFVDFGLESQVARCLTNEEFANLSNIRFLQVGNAKLDGDFKRLLLKLRWLHWNGCPEIFRPTNFHLKNLVILDLSRSEEVTEAWKGWNHIKIARKLKVLNLTSCKYMVRTPDFSAYATLERLILEGCENLVHIDPSIGYLKSLVFLNVKNCAKLKRLPPEFDYVEALTELLIDRTSIQEVPIGRGVLKKLEILSATSCCSLTQISTSIGYLTSLSDLTLDYSPITELPNSIGSLVKLQCLSLRNCELEELPESIGKLESLIEMHLSGENFRQLPDSFGNLKSLRILKIKCQNLKEIRSLGRLKSLEFLVVSCCISLETLPDLSNLKLLEKLKLKGCKKLHEIKGLKGLKSLKMLDFSLCTALEGIHDLSNSEMLEELNLCDCQKLHEIECLKALKSLKMLDLSGCTTLERIPDLSNMKMLKKLNFYNCQKLHEIEGLKDLKSLKMLDLSLCTALERLPDLSKMEMLEKLKSCNCQKLHEVDGLKDLKSLKMLDLSGCTALERLQDLSNSKLLEELYLYNCLKLHEIEGLEALESLMMLDLSSCIALKRLPDLSNLERLEELKLAGCQMLQEIEGLTSSKSLKMLDLSGCTALERLPDLSNGEMLEELKLAGCLKLHEIEGLKALKSLKMTDLTGCTALERLPDVLNVEMLEELKLTGCEMLHEIEGIMSLKSLKMLNLSGCTTLERLPDLSSMEMLDELKLIGCLKLHEIEGLKALKSLKMMDLSGCTVLERLPDLSKMEMLEELKLVGCEKLHEIKGLETLKSLKMLDLSGCTALERLPDVLNVEMLEELKLTGCEMLHEIEGLISLKFLKMLNLSGCTTLERLPDLSNMEMLDELKLVGCLKLHEIEGLKALKSLKMMDLSGCTILKRLPDLSKMEMLEELKLVGCEKLHEINGLEALKSLKMLDLSGCTALERLPDLLNNSLFTSPPAEWDYEVFLSFRSEDPCKTFTDYLYTDLGEAGIRTFRDDDELRIGEKIGPELLEAIQHSKISIPVFSKHYASSKWCLLELTQMVECKRSFGQMILPIFYDVEPSDVQHQTGSYEQAFQEHEKKYDSTTVKGWKKALREVGELSGWNVKNR
ncbi:disease resistance protein L6-like [Cornus florida]|uniref:disease resistance protein L6-like n=1 Tax=Cornus florida TaxID=4283 RepID=UPI0028978606|nr:disease resistance protein L6-like [Cornus florida]